MLPALEQLLILQDRDRKIRALRHEQKMMPLEKKELEEKLVSTSASLEALKLKSREIEVQRKKLEVDAQAKRDQIGKYRSQQFQTRKNEEFQALGHEIKRAEADIQAIEDQELELMDQTEKMKVEVAATEKAAAQTKSQVNTQIADLDAKVKAIEGELQRIEAERAGLAAQVDEDLLNRYDRLFASKGDAAVVSLEHEVCMGCHMKITTQTAVRVKGNREIVNCDQCGRILYHEA